MQENLEINDIMINTETNSMLTQCENIGKNWVKQCPKCGKKQIYSSYDSLRCAKHKNTICLKCNGKNQQKYIFKIRHCPNCNKKIEYRSRRGFVLATRNNTLCHSCWCIKREENKDKSIYRNPETIKKISCKLKIIRKDTTKYGETFKEKCRKNRAIQLKNGIGGKVNYNPKACKFIDELNAKMGWTLIHALNGGEKMIEGFFLDGYDELRNIVFEYDEPKHYTLYQRRRDKIKENVILKYLSPSEFWRYDEKENKLYNIMNERIFK